MHSAAVTVSGGGAGETVKLKRVWYKNGNGHLILVQTENSELKKKYMGKAQMFN